MKFLSMRAELFHRMDGRKDVRTDRETDGHDQANSRFSKIFERA
jgi:hypothetical protein